MREVARNAVRQQRRVEKQPTSPSFDTVLNQLHWSMPLGSVLAWLKRDENIAAMEQMMEQQYLKSTSNSHAASMLRLYYAVALRLLFKPVISGRAKRDNKIAATIGALCFDAVQRHVNAELQRGGIVNAEPFVQVARRIAVKDVDAVDMGGRQDAYIAEIQKNTDPKYLHFKTAITDVFVLVAAEILAERQRINGGQPTSGRDKR